MSEKFISKFFKGLAYTAKDMGEAFTLDFYLHRGREYNLCYPDDHERFKKGVHNLKRRGYVKPTKNNRFKFTRKGKKWYQENAFKYSPFRIGKWDGKWRIVFFDIPEELRKKRDVLRYRLKNLGFYSLQKSAFVIPFECEKEIAEMTSKLRVNRHVDILIVESIGIKENELKKIFNL